MVVSGGGVLASIPTARRRVMSILRRVADLLDQLVTATQQFVICGDFNCPGTDGRQLKANLVDVLQQYDAVQHVVDATRGDVLICYLA